MHYFPSIAKKLTTQVPPPNQQKFFLRTWILKTIFSLSRHDDV